MWDMTFRNIQHKFVGSANAYSRQSEEVAYQLIEELILILRLCLYMLRYLKQPNLTGETLNPRPHPISHRTLR